MFSKPEGLRSAVVIGAWLVILVIFWYIARFVRFALSAVWPL